MNTSDTVRIQSQKDPAQLEREIDQQRNHIGELIGALENKMSPGQIFDMVISRGKGGGHEFTSNLARTVKQNPMPTLLTAAGLAWLMAGQRHGDSTSHATAYSSDTHPDKPGIGERVGQARHNAGEKIGAARERIGDSAHHAVDSVKDRARRANEGVHNMMDENPLALGAMGIAVGALLGAMLPATRKEDELMGPTRDRFMDKGRDKLEEGYRKASEAGHDISSGGSDTGTGRSPGSSATGATATGTRTSASSGTAGNGGVTRPSAGTGSL
ncbi:DUF3618 domain-containing protein [Novilysobacter spongiicola]|uniref:Membrane-anchored ribosome-binding protein, inhibits growth in stationary phase, ElaB/YqjD/DUF883 family n=1 Tax=Lysobacter spongiicola DSM 21749 TaxID=1122188 RepID=A0A1T4LIT0_9GAMM|nr:DUF3618 domain-containing protein [Lysobacter spongiicola]SJZ54531.1 Protein of unknown function [Lysobacter spongiicola DSM 21749]